MDISHIGYAVRDIENAIETFKSIGYKLISEIFCDEKRNIKICFIENNNVVVELVSPLGEKSPIDIYLKKIGNTPYHICYSIKNDIYEECKKLNELNFRTIIEPDEAIAFDGKKVAFLFNEHIGLIEIVSNI